MLKSLSDWHMFQISLLLFMHLLMFLIFSYEYKVNFLKCETEKNNWYTETCFAKKTRKKCEIHDCLFANFMETMLLIFHSKRNLDRKKIVSNFLFTSFYCLSVLCGIVSFRTWFYVNQRSLNILHMFIFLTEFFGNFVPWKAKSFQNRYCAFY